MLLESKSKIFALIIFWMLFTVFESLASHILGSTMYYKCLGNNEYRIDLEVYLDDGVVPPDPSVLIGIYNCGNLIPCETLTQFDIFLAVEASLDSTAQILPPTYPSGTPFNLFEAKVAYYHINVTLPASIESYFIVYQRFGVNSTVHAGSNIIKQLTSMIELTPLGNNLCNNSSKFKKPPLNLICVDEELIYDFEPFDLDGDSLAHMFFSPFGFTLDNSGSNCDYTFPNPPCPPPYDTMVYNTLYYNKPFGFATKVQNIENNGILTVLPQQISQFLTGMQSNEYRNGELICSTYHTMITAVMSCLFTTQASENKIEGGVKIAPNPFQNEISFSTLSENKIKRIEFINSQGISQLLLNQNFQNINTSILVGGLYFVKITRDDETSTIMKTIKE